MTKEVHFKDARLFLYEDKIIHHVNGLKEKITQSYHAVQKLFPQNSTPIHDINSQKNSNRGELSQIDSKHQQKPYS